MSDKKHIDRLFQEKFKDFNETPKPEVWANIEKQLVNKQVTAVKFPLWLKLSSTAAVLLLFTALSFTYFNNKKLIDNTVVKTDNNTKLDTDNSIKNSTNSSNKTFNELSKTNSNSVLVEENKDQQLSSPNLSNTEDTYTNNLPKGRNENSSIIETSDKTNSSINTTRLTKTEQNNSNSTLASTKVKNSNSSYGSSDETINSKNKSHLVSTSTKNNSLEKNLVNSKTQNQKENNFNNALVSSSKTNSSVTNNGFTSTYKKGDNTNNPNINSSKNIANPSAFKTKPAINSNNKNINNTLSSSVLNTETKPLVDIKTDSLFVISLELKDGKSIEEAIAENEETLRKEAIGKRWAISPNIAPVYYNSFGNGSQFHDQFVNNKKTGETNTSYGITVGYAINKDFRIRTGIHQVNLSYDTDNVIVFESVSNTPNENPLRNITFNNQINTQGISVISADNLGVQQISSTINDNFNAALSQRIQYIEVPVEVEYQLSKKRFGVNIIGGFSSFILSDNQVVSEFDGYQTELGKANNINNLSFSTNLGIGLNYSFSKSFVYNFEPTFKYQINGFSNTSGSFNPYIIGVYTGFSYKF